MLFCQNFYNQWHFLSQILHTHVINKDTHVDHFYQQSRSIAQWRWSGYLPECCNSDEAMHVCGKGQNSTPRHAITPEKIFSKIGMRDHVTDGTRHAKFCNDQFRVFCSPNAWIWRACGVNSFLFVYGVFNKTIAYTPERILRKIRQKTSFQLRKCILWFPVIMLHIWPAISESAILGTDFD